MIIKVTANWIVCAKLAAYDWSRHCQYHYKTKWRWGKREN